MKKIFLIFLFVFLIVPQATFGQSPSPSEDADDSVVSAEEKVDQIKDKVTSKVAKLKLVEKKGIVGTVDSVSANEIRINDLNDKTRIIEVDELTKYSSGDDATFDLSSIKEGTKISAIGLYNKDSGKLLARFINEISIPVFLNGVISDKNKQDFTVTLSTEDEINYIVDIENITKSFSFSDGELDTSGFTKIEPMQNAIIIGFPDSKDENRITATRIITFPNVPRNPRIDVETPTKKPSKSLSPSAAPTDK